MTTENYNTSDCVRDTRQHIRQVQDNLTVVISELLERIKAHDDSKFSDVELDTFVRVTPRLRESVYGSDEYKANLADMQEALKHHYANNRHHPEFYSSGYRDMDLVDLLEMLLDWLAATKRHNTGNIFDSIKINQNRFGYSEELAQFFRNTIHNYFPNEKES
jgi:hypothetical protein